MHGRVPMQVPPDWLAGRHVTEPHRQGQLPLAFQLLSGLRRDRTTIIPDGYCDMLAASVSIGLPTKRWQTKASAYSLPSPVRPNQKGDERDEHEQKWQNKVCMPVILN
jgi:hypothetical protein